MKAEGPEQSGATGRLARGTENMPLTVDLEGRPVPVQADVCVRSSGPEVRKGCEEPVGVLLKPVRANSDSLRLARRRPQRGRLELVQVDTVANHPALRGHRRHCGGEQAPHGVGLGYHRIGQAMCCEANALEPGNAVERHHVFSDDESKAASRNAGKGSMDSRTFKGSEYDIGVELPQDTADPQTATDPAQTGQAVNRHSRVLDGRVEEAGRPIGENGNRVPAGGEEADEKAGLSLGAALIELVDDDQNTGAQRVRSAARRGETATVCQSSCHDCLLQR